MAGNWRSKKLLAASRGPSARSRFAATRAGRLLRVETLEDRRMLAGVTVGNTLDVVNGDVASIAALVASPGADGISLREAVLAANADAAADVIDFAVTGEIQLTNVGHAGEIAITKDLTITGPGANLLTIRAFAGTAAAGDGARIFNIDDGNQTQDYAATISGATLTGGDIVANGGVSGGGGAIRTTEPLTLVEVVIDGNSASFGGGISSFAARSILLTIVHSTISNNVAYDAGGFSGGGGIYARTAIRIIQSTVSDNRTTGPTVQGGPGGGIYGLVDIFVEQSTISGNVVNGFITTIAGNVGAGIHGTVNGPIQITQSTIVNNHSNTTVAGGGVVSDGLIVIRGSIIANNDAGGGGYQTDLADGMSEALPDLIITNSLVGNGLDAGLAESQTPDGNGNLVGWPLGVGTPIDPLLGPLADNGGPTFTHALLPGSPAIDRSALTDDTMLFDQRGAPFARVAGARVDMGAFELQAAAPSANFDGDADVDGNDFLIWQRGFGLAAGATTGQGNADGDADVDGGDLAVWRAQFGGAGLIAAATPAGAARSGTSAQASAADLVFAGDYAALATPALPISRPLWRPRRR